MPSLKQQIIISSNKSGKRLDKFLFDELNEKSRSYIQNSILKGEVLVNDNQVKSGYKLKNNDIININIQKETEISIQPEDLPLDILFEDDSLIIINKPAGMVVHPGAGNKTGTLVNALVYHCNKLSDFNNSLRPGIVHRLDKDTSGLLVVAKDNPTHLNLQEQFKTKEISRVYISLVWGVPLKKEGEIESFIVRSRKDRTKMTVSASQGKAAKTNYKLLIDYKYLSLLELKLNTGRTHQIRVHLAHNNLPVFGDPVYNGRKSQLRRLPSNLQKRGETLLKKINRQTLHAKELSLIHPKTNKKITFKSDLPNDIKDVLENIDKILLLK